MISIVDLFSRCCIRHDAVSNVQHIAGGLRREEEEEEVAPWRHTTSCQEITYRCAPAANISATLSQGTATSAESSNATITCHDM